MSKLILRTMYSTSSSPSGKCKQKLAPCSLSPQAFSLDPLSARSLGERGREMSSGFLVSGATPGRHQFNRLFPLAIPSLTEVQYENKFLHFHWLLGMSGSLMGSWRKLQCFEGCFAETLQRIDVCITKFSNADG